MGSREHFCMLAMTVALATSSLFAQGWRTTPYRVQDPAGLSAATPGDRAGSRVVVLGDVSGDGRDDVAVGAPAASVGGLSGAGRIELRSGGDLSVLSTAYGSFAGDGLGATLARVPDMDGDGVDDLAAGLAAGATRDARIAWISGATAGSLGETLLPGTAGTSSQPVVRPWRDLTGDGRVEYVVAGLRDANRGLIISVLDRATGVVMISSALPLVEEVVPWPRCDVIVADRDLDGDAQPDVLLGSPQARVAGAPLPGSRGVVVAFDGPGLTMRWMRAGLATNGAFGSGLLTVPDLDSDELREVLVGAPGLPGAAGQLVVLSGLTGQPLLSISSSSVAVQGLGESLAHHADPLQGPRDELVLAGAAPAVGGAGTVALGFTFGAYGPVQTSAVLAVDPATLSSWPRTQLATGGDFDGDGRPDVTLGIDALQWSTSVHWFRSAGSLVYGLLDPTTQALQLDGSFQGWRVRGGASGNPCLCTVGLMRRASSTLGVTTYVDLAVPGTFLLWTEPFDVVGRASFIVGAATPLPLITGLTLQVQGFSLGAGAPPTLLASNGLQITL